MQAFRPRAIASPGGHGGAAAGFAVAAPFLKGLGAVELGLAAWVMAGIAPGTCAIVNNVACCAQCERPCVGAANHPRARRHGCQEHRLPRIGLGMRRHPWGKAVKSESAWQAGRLGSMNGPHRLLFGQMYEDAEIERAAFQGKGRVFCIASAGTRRSGSPASTKWSRVTSTQPSLPMPSGAPQAGRRRPATQSG